LSRPTCHPCYKIEQCKQKTRTKNAHAKYFVLDHPVNRPDKIAYTNIPPQNAHMRSEL